MGKSVFPTRPSKPLTKSLRATQEDIHGDANSTLNGIDAWADKGIAGRGVLIDYFDWSKKNGIEYEVLSNHPIPVEHVQKIIREKKIAIRQGDIFLLRTGEVMLCLTDCGRRIC